MSQDNIALRLAKKFHDQGIHYEPELINVDLANVTGAYGPEIVETLKERLDSPHSRPIYEDIRGRQARFLDDIYQLPARRQAIRTELSEKQKSSQRKRALLGSILGAGLGAGLGTALKWKRSRTIPAAIGAGALGGLGGVLSFRPVRLGEKTDAEYMKRFGNRPDIQDYAGNFLAKFL